MTPQEIITAKERIRLQDEFNKACKNFRELEHKFLNAHDNRKKLSDNLQLLHDYPVLYFSRRRKEEEEEEKLERYFMEPVKNNESLILI